MNKDFIKSVWRGGGGVYIKKKHFLTSYACDKDTKTMTNTKTKTKTITKTIEKTNTFHLFFM